MAEAVARAGANATNLFNTVFGTGSQTPGQVAGQDVVVNGQTKHTLYIANDNDFLPVVNGLSNPNQFFVFSFDDADLGGSTFRNQRF